MTSEPGNNRASAATRCVKDVVLPGNFAGNVLEVSRYVLDEAHVLPRVSSLKVGHRGKPVKTSSARIGPYAR